MTKQNYAKICQSPSDLISLLKSRGLSFTDEARAESYLTNISYFRLSAYFYPLLKDPKTDHQYKEDASFDNVMNMYRFDRKLRILLFNEIEKIEVAIRSVFVHEICIELADPFWMTNPTYFHNRTWYGASKTKIDIELSRSKEEFITHFKNRYDNPYPPAWMLVEIITLGNLSKIYSNLKSKSLKKIVAQKFGIEQSVFTSWIIQIGNLRNMCCHHSRMWNREFPLPPTNPNKTHHAWIDVSAINTKRVYYRICMIKYLLFSVSPYNTFTDKLKDLIISYPTIDTRAMGFPDNWQSEPLWV